MNYVITGSLGNISRPVSEKLIAAGHKVSIITHSNERANDIEAMGATALVGSVEDPAFLRKAFGGADAVYTMVPPKWDAADWKKHIGQVGKNYAEALKANQVKYVVNLSSIGAHLANGVGPVSGLYLVEQALNSLEDTNVLHIRPGYFFSNYYGSIGMIKNMGILGSNNPAGNSMVLSHTSDIAEVVASALLQLAFKGHSVKYLASDERTFDETAKVLGNAVGNPNLPWVEFTDEQSVAGMLQAGLNEEVAKNYTEMGAAMRTGIMMEDFYKNNAVAWGKVKLEDFAKEFAEVYKAQAE
jgi:uncharacterized protein YbjT (DUF2867 family)